MIRNKLALFNDGTLVKGFKGHGRAFSEGFKKVYGVDAVVDTIGVQGMTEQQVIIEVLKQHGLNEEEIKSKIEECMRVMIDCFKEIIATDEIILLDGVQELLRKLKDHDILMGLVTGNLEPIGRDKLGKVKIYHYFRVGGFGNDDLDRANLVRLAIERAEEYYGFEFNNNVYLFGDAPQDMKAGKEVGVKTIGVTTGVCSKQRLEKAGADFVLKNLKDTERILKIIGG